MWFIISLALFLPRVLIAILHFFTSWFVGVFQTWYWPLLGFLFAPYTMLWYSVVTNWYGGTWSNWHLAVLCIAILFDFSSGRKGMGRS